MSDKPEQNRNSLTETPPRDETIWRQRWFQVSLGVLVFTAMLSLVLPQLLELLYMTRPVLVPVVLALGLAYIFNPVVTFLHRRLGLPRVGGTIVILLSGLLGGVMVLLIVVPPLISQGASLIENIKDQYPKVMLKVVDAAERAEQRRQQQNTPETPAPNVATANADTTDATAPPDEPNVVDETVRTEVEQSESFIETWLDRLLDQDRVREMILNFSERAQNLEWSQIGTYVVQTLDIGVGVVGSAISFTTYLIISGVVVLFCFFYFSWQLPSMAKWFVPFIPLTVRDRSLALLSRMDHTVSAFVRGRVIQVAILMTVLSTGWYLCGVPYWLLLGVLGGLLNLIPYAAIISWPLAVLFASLDSLSGSGGFSLMWAVILPSVVYMIGQGLDGWIIEPLLQGQATDLDPLSVMLVVLLGASVAGLLGMLLAIPVAACVKILFSELLLPKLRTMAEKY